MIQKLAKFNTEIVKELALKFMSAKEIKQKLNKAGVDSSDCLEKRDLIKKMKECVVGFSA